MGTGKVSFCGRLRGFDSHESGANNLSSPATSWQNITRIT